jgi:hypothetical protein
MCKSLSTIYSRIPAICAIGISLSDATISVKLTIITNTNITRNILFNMIIPHAADKDDFYKNVSENGFAETLSRKINELVLPLLLLRREIGA